jgi:hypothetical protein
MSRVKTQRQLADGLAKTITVTVPIKLVRRGGRKTVMSPVPYAPPPPNYDNAMVKALARSHRWRRMIETGRYSSITELAKAEKVNESYACRLLRLTLLAPEIVESILNGGQRPALTLSQLLRPLPLEWQQQLSRLHGARSLVSCNGVRRV